MAEEPVFIPCEICDEQVELSEYSTHTEACNSARFVEFHGVSLNELLNSVNHVIAPPPDIDFADNLASGNVSEEEPEEEDEEEPEEEDEGIIGREPQLNVRVIPMGALIHALIGDIPIDNQQQPPLGLEPPSIDNLMNRLQNLITAAAQAQQLNGIIDGGLGNLEDITVGLTPEQRNYCLTTKRISKPTDTKDELGTCNICCEDNLEEMTTLICGHELCTPCATKHFTDHVKCPFCNQDLRDMMNPNA